MKVESVKLGLSWTEERKKAADDYFYQVMTNFTTAEEALAGDDYWERTGRTTAGLDPEHAEQDRREKAAAEAALKADQERMAASATP